MDLWSWISWFFWSFVFIAYLMVLFSILADIFRDHELNGWMKALWILLLVFVPFLTALVYLIARGDGMTRRSMSQARSMQAAQDEYIRQTAGSTSSVSDIATAKSLLDSGAITQAEYEALKAEALRSQGSRPASAMS
ncbi:MULTISPECIES: SHOCT domain-containing protein [unclassified Cryobacterium]|uniref:SHOCT domain-containing protein n=1 Tax=unclassified Cryobacterium TaxID=2649013 RepID=UPI001445330C|nr:MULTISPECIES: SHOCT domain-containing protein [unclassified Cryobacterium]